MNRIKTAALGLLCSMTLLQGLQGLPGLGAAAAQSNSLKGGDAPVRNPSTPMISLHAEALMPLLTELGIDHQGATLPGGQKVVLATAPGGLKFQITPTACDDSGARCKGVNMLALFNTRAQERTVSAFNYRYAFVSTGLDDSGVAYISRYDIADYGVPRGNLAVSVQTFIYMSSLFDRHLYEASNTVQKRPSDMDLAAHGLNMQTVLADVSLSRQLGLDAAGHEVSFEEITRFVDSFVRADSLSPGRLINEVKAPR